MERILRHGLQEGRDDALPPGAEAGTWLAAAQTNRSRDPLPNLYNVMLALRDDARLNDLLVYEKWQSRSFSRERCRAGRSRGTTIPTPGHSGMTM